MSTTPSSGIPHLAFPQKSSRAAPELSTMVGGDSRQHPIKVGLWNYYEELTTNGFIFKNNNAAIGHNLLKPWVDLYRYGQMHGIDFVTLDQVQSPQELDAVIFMDRPNPQSPNSAVLVQLMSSNIPKYLCTFEPEIIKPDNWSIEHHQQYDRVFTFSDTHIDAQNGSRYQKLNFAIDLECSYVLDDLNDAFALRKLCTVIAGAKQSSHPHELYSERLRAVRWFEEHAPQDFDLYGTGWEANAFPSYRGMVQDKLATLASYRFCICYENARNMPGYITEKILDCFRAGVVPIYLGAPNISRWIPSDCFIDRTAFASYADLYDYLHSMDASTHAAYLGRIDSFLNSPLSHPFSIDYFINSLTSQLVRDVQAQRQEQPLVSVTIPTYNYGRYVGQAIKSALAQGIEGMEILVFDNASTDNTASVVAALDCQNLRYMRQPRNIGGLRNWYDAFHNATGRYIAMLSADDAFMSDHLMRMIDVMESNPNIALCYCPCIWMDEAGEPLYEVRPHGHPTNDAVGGRNEAAMLLAHDCFVTPSAALVRRAALDQVGNIDLSLQGAVDWDLWIRLAERFPDFGFFKDPRVLYRIHSEQDTARLMKSAGLLSDHVQILESALARGGLRRLVPMIPPIVALLKAKAAAYPQDMVTHLVPRIAALTQQLEAACVTQAAAATGADIAPESATFLAALRGELDVLNLINAADRLANTGRPDLAAILYRLWLAQSDSDLRYVAAFNLAVLLEQMGDSTEAIGLYRQALKWNSTLTQAAERLRQLSNANT